MEYGLWGMDYERIEIKRRDWRLMENAIGIMGYVTIEIRD